MNLQKQLSCVLIISFLVIGNVRVVNIETIEHEHLEIKKFPRIVANSESLLYGPIYMMEIGGSNVDLGYSFCLDKNGTYYLTGRTNSPDYPVVNPYDDTLNGLSDVLITGISDNGTTTFSTFFGGINSDVGNAIDSDKNGGIYITGYTRSDDFPTLNAYQDIYRGNQDIIIAKFNPDKSLNYSTYFGGSNIENAYDIAVTENGECFIVGYTESANFPILNAYDSSYNGGTYGDAFISKLNLDGTLNFSTFLGGASSEALISIELDADGAFYVTGYQHPDLFVAKFNSDGTHNFSKTIPGGYTGSAYSIAVDQQKNCYITGYQRFDIYPQQDDDVIIAKVNFDGTLNYSTLIRGFYNELGTSIIVDDYGACYVTGFTDSNDFPTLNAYDIGYNGNTDPFLVKLNPSGTLNYSTFLGSTAYEGANQVLFDDNNDFCAVGVTDHNILFCKIANPLGDKDLDGLPNYWEYQMNLDYINAIDSGMDNDLDGLNNTLEFQLGTNPQNNDSDLDFMDDGWEFYYGLDPAVMQEKTDDFDSDGIPDYYEFIWGFNPSNPMDAALDADEDGMPNIWEFQNDFNPLDPGDAVNDRDNDGLNNFEEYLLGTNPRNQDSDGDGWKDSRDPSPLSHFWPNSWFFITIPFVAGFPILLIRLKRKSKRKQIPLF